MQRSAHPSKSAWIRTSLRALAIAMTVAATTLGAAACGPSHHHHHSNCCAGY